MQTIVIGWLLLVAATGSMAQFNKWLRNTDLNNPYNWNRGNLPCGNDRMIIPDDSPVVFMQMNTTIQELVLPSSAELVFGSYAIMAFTNEPDHSAACLDSGTDITFNASHPADWFDPDNWCPTDTEQGECKPRAMLDTERIPCVTDHVVFPMGSSYYVDLRSNINIQINTLKVSSKAYSTSSFRDFVATENGRNIFPAPQVGIQSTVTMNRRHCTDQTGCGCGNDKEPIQSTVCGVLRARCARAPCSKPIRPRGHCCDVCGGQLNITYGTGFNFDTLKSGIQRNFLDDVPGAADTSYIVSKMSDGSIQIVLLDKDGVASSKLATLIYSDLITDMNNGGVRYGVTKVTMRASNGAGSSTTDGGGNTSQHTGSKTSSLSGGSVAAVTIGCIIGALALAGAGFMFYKRKYKPGDDDGSGFTANMFNKFNRFNTSQKRKPQVSVPPSVGFSWGSQDSGLSGLSSVSGNLSQGFDNPIYGSAPLEDMKSMEMEMRATDFGSMSEDQPKDVGFDNPLYDVEHHESLFSDATAVDKPELPTVMTIGGPGQKEDEA